MPRAAVVETPELHTDSEVGLDWERILRQMERAPWQGNPMWKHRSRRVPLGKVEYLSMSTYGVSWVPGCEMSYSAYQQFLQRTQQEIRDHGFALVESPQDLLIHIVEYRHNGE